METRPFAIGPGTVLSRFQILERVGSGGMGQVFRARDAALGRDVAIKILPPDAVVTTEKRRRFETEAKVVAALSHPSIVPVYDIGECSGIPYIVQELISGEMVDELLWRRGAQPVEMVAEWGVQIADALATAHDAGVLHRDIKPGNLIIDGEGRVRVLDFGLAKILERPGLPSGEGQRLTTDGMIVGTVHYMSPEQAQGEEIDGRSDIFSLGIVLYEMSVGKRPFQGETAVDVMHAIVHDPAGLPEAGPPPLPEAFLAVVEKALEKRLDERYQSIREMSADLRRFLRRSHDATAVRPVLRPSGASAVPAPPPSLAPEKKRRPLALGASALVLLTVAAAVIHSRGQSRPKAPLDTKILLQSDYREQEPIYSPNGKGFAYVSNESGQSNVYYRLFTSSSPVRLTQMGGENLHPAFAPDGGSILFSHEEPGSLATSILAVPTLGGAVRRILDDGDEPALSKDGKRLLFIRRAGQRRALVVARADGTDQKTILEGGAGVLLGARFSNDGTFIAFFWRPIYPNDSGDVWRIPSDGGQPVRLTKDSKDVWGHVEFLPDDSAILFGAQRTSSVAIWMVPAAGGEPVEVVPGSSRLVSPSISPDGKSLLVQAQHFISDAWEVSIADGRAAQLTTSGFVWAPARLPDGRLLYGDWAQPGDNLDVVVEDAKGVRTLMAKGGTVRPSADGKRIYFSQVFPDGARGLTVMETAGGPPRRITDEPGCRDDWPDPSPDERFVVFLRTYNSGKIALCAVDPASGSVETVFDGDAIEPRATLDNVLFRSCIPNAGCGVFVKALSGGPPRLLIPDGHYPAASRDGRTVYAWVGSKHDPQAVSVPIDGSSPVRRLFDFNSARAIQFWAVHTLDVSPDGRSLVVTQQRMNDDVLLMEGVFR